jgi:ribonuclease P protein component
MVAKYWPAAVQREENGSRFPVKQIDRNAIPEYLQNGQRTTMRGITLYTKPTESLEVGFLIRRKAGSAVQRNKTRRVFRGLLLNAMPSFLPQRGYLFLFHRSFYSASAVSPHIEQLVHRSAHAN